MSAIPASGAHADDPVERLVDAGGMAVSELLEAYEALPPDKRHLADRARRCANQLLEAMEEAVRWNRARKLQ